MVRDRVCHVRHDEAHGDSEGHEISRPRHCFRVGYIVGVRRLERTRENGKVGGNLWRETVMVVSEKNVEFRKGKGGERM